MIHFPGGAHKFEQDIYEEVSMRLNKFDEIDSLVHGVEFMVNNNDADTREVFYYKEVEELKGEQQVITKCSLQPSSLY